MAKDGRRSVGKERKNTSMQGYAGMKGKLMLNCQWDETVMFEQGGECTR